MLEEFLEENKRFFEPDYVPVKIDTLRMTHGAEVARKIRDADGGIPWMAVYFRPLVMDQAAAWIVSRLRDMGARYLASGQDCEDPAGPAGRASTGGLRQNSSMME